MKTTQKTRGKIPIKLITSNTHKKHQEIIKWTENLEKVDNWDSLAYLFLSP